MGSIGHEDIQAWLAARSRELDVVGCSLGMLDSGKLKVACAGVREVGAEARITPDTVFQIGSITKIFTTMQILQLVDRGRLHLDEPVARYLPTFALKDPAMTEAVTVRYLLNHTSGIDGDFFPEDPPTGDAFAAYFEKLSEQPALAPVGRYMTYCNAGWVVLGRLIEGLTGVSWEQALHRDVLEPVGIRNAFTRVEDATDFSCAVGHVAGADESTPWLTTPTPYLQRSLAPAGARLTMDVASLLRFAKMHLRGGANEDGEQVLSHTSCEAMQTGSVDLPPISVRSNFDSWGLGWACRGSGEGRVIGHDGGTVGQYAYLRLMPGRDFALALLTNSPSVTLWNAIESELMPEIAPPERGSGVSSFITNDMGSLLGVYENVAGTMTVSESESVLKLHVSSRLPGSEGDLSADMVWVRDGVYELRGTPGLEGEICFLDSDEEGRAVYLRHGLRMAKRREAW